MCRTWTRLWPCLLGLTMGAWWSVASGASGDPALEVFRLESGLTVVLGTNHAQPVVAVSAFVDTGSRTEDEHFSGALHFIEHLVFKGGTRRFAPTLFRKRIMELGQESGGWTSWDAINFGFTVPRENLEPALDVFCDSLLRLTWERQRFEDEKRVVLQELEKYEEDPDNQLWKAFYETAFTVHPYKREIGGVRAGVAKLTMEEVRDYWKARFVPNHIVLAVVGDVDRRKLMALLTKGFEGLERGRESFELGLLEPEQRTARRTERTSPNTTQTRFALGFVGPAASSPEGPALTLIAWLLSSGSEGLDAYLTKGYQWVTSVGASSTQLRDATVLCVTGECPPAHAAKVTTWLTHFLTTLDVAHWPEGDFEAAKRRFEKTYLAQRETFAQQALELGQRMVVAGEGSMRDFHRRVLALTRAEVDQVARRVLKGGRVTLALLTPRGAADSRGLATGARQTQPPADAASASPTAARTAPQSAPASAQSPAPSTAAGTAMPASAPDAGATPGEPSIVRATPAYAPPPSLEVAGLLKPSAKPALEFTREEGPAGSGCVRFRFWNGLTLVVDRAAAASIVSVTARVQGGQVADPQGKEGLGWMMASLLLRGTRRFDRDTFERLLADQGLALTPYLDSGARNNTSMQVDYRDSWGLHFQTVEAGLKPGLALLKEALFFPVFAAPEVDKERARQTAAIADLAEDNFETLRQEFYQRIFKGHPYGRPVMGTATSVASIGRNDLRMLHERFVTPDRTTLAIVGDVDPDAVASFLATTWADLPSGHGDPLPSIALDAAPRAGTETLARGRNQWTIAWGAPTVARDDPRFVPLWTLFGIIQTEHFFRYVYEKGVSYRSWFKLWAHRGPAVWICENDLERKTFDQSAASIHADIARYARGVFTQEELEKAKRRMVNSLVLERQSSLLASWGLACAQGYGLGYEEYLRRPDDVKGVSLETVNTLARDVLGTRAHFELDMK